MDGSRNSPELGLNRSDYVASAAKAALGAFPFAGSLLVEIAGTVIPNQRIERIALFAEQLEERIGHLEAQCVRENLTDEEFTDMVEEALHQAARSTTDQRRSHIASIVAASLTSKDVSFIESKHLLKLLGEINDIEAIWLRSYLQPTIGGDEEFRAANRDLLTPRHAMMGASQVDVDQATLQRSYKEHLAQLGLLKERYRVDSQTKMPVFDRMDGRPEANGYELTRLGRLLLRQVGFEDPYARAAPSSDVNEATT